MNIRSVLVGGFNKDDVLNLFEEYQHKIKDLSDKLSAANSKLKHFDEIQDENSDLKSKLYNSEQENNLLRQKKAENELSSNEKAAELELRESEFEQLKSKYDKLLSDYDLLINDRANILVKDAIDYSENLLLSAKNETDEIYNHFNSLINDSLITVESCKDKIVSAQADIDLSITTINKTVDGLAGSLSEVKNKFSGK
ncbi:MAG: hypothetical protein K6B52_06855 [Clostridiales bacterium]|nr:hypothetical protein [Clostridiales bacterium]